MSACGDDGNNGGKPDVIDGSQAWSLVTFQRLSDGSFYYHDGQSPDDEVLQNNVFGNGWKLVKANEIGDDGRMITNSYYAQVPSEAFFLTETEVNSMNIILTRTGSLPVLIRFTPVVMVGILLTAMQALTVGEIPRL